MVHQLPETPLRTADALHQTRPVIEAIVRRKLRVSLDRADGRRENQDGLQLIGDIQLELVEKIRRLRPGEHLHNLQSFAAVVAYNTCSDYLRRLRPEKTSLANRLRYFLRHARGYAVIESESGDLQVGFASWRNTPEPGSAARLHQLLGDSRWCHQNRPPGSLETMGRSEWTQLVDSCLNAAGGPVWLDDLLAFLTSLLKIQDKPLEALPPSAALPEAGPKVDPVSLREMLARLWAEIEQLSPRQRAAYLLNMTDGEIEVFPENGIAGVARIGAVVALSDAQYALLWENLAWTAAERLMLPALSTPPERWAMCWRKLPLEDKMIAQLLGATRQQVINLRKVARERLARRMASFR